MSKPRKSKKFPHVIRAPLLDKVLCVLFTAFYIYLVWLFFNRWDITNASDKPFLLLFLLGAFIGLFIIILRLFFAESILEEKWIIKTNAFLMKRRIMYEEIKAVSVTSTDMGIRLDLVDRSAVGIYCGDLLEAVKVHGLIDSKLKVIKKQRMSN
ncbi:MAG: hypothetical protein WKF90_16880 [Pyrinomonadaceae bacterium]